MSRFVAAFNDQPSEHTKYFWQKIVESVYWLGRKWWFPPLRLDPSILFLGWGKGGSLHSGGRELSLDGVWYGTVPIKSLLVDNVPSDGSAAPVTVNDSGYEFIAGMLAGPVGIGTLGSVDGEPTANGSVGKNTLWPEAGCWMMKVKPENQTAGVLLDYFVVMG